jgi:enoyl-CoA hydratase/carnithine racemase
VTEELPGSVDETEAIVRDIGRIGSAIDRSLDGPVAVLTMCHAPYNLIGEHLLGELIEALSWVRAQNARAMVLRSSLRHFCAGADLDELDGPISRGTAPDLPVLDALHGIEALPIPTIASVHGTCVGGGFELALACDLLVATRSARIGCVEATLGLTPLMGAVQRITQRAGESRAKEMAMLARRYDTATLERWGLVNRVVPDAELDATVMTMAQELAHGPTEAHRATKAIAAIAANEGVEAADQAMASTQLPVWASEDLKLGLASYRQGGPGQARFGGR